MVYYFNFSATSSLTTCGFAFPPVAFNTCPTKKPNSFVLPALNFSTLSGFFEMISSIIGKIIPMLNEWKIRPLEEVYPFVFLDAIHYKVKEEANSFMT